MTKLCIRKNRSIFLQKYVIGANAETYKSGMLENGWQESDIKVFNDSAEAKAEIASFSGSIFIKGSRVCELEKSLPTELFELLSTGSLPTPEAQSSEESLEGSLEVETQEELPESANDTSITPSDAEDEFEEYDEDTTDDEYFSDEDFSEDEEIIETDEDNEDERETI